MIDKIRREIGLFKKKYPSKKVIIELNVLNVMELLKECNKYKLDREKLSVRFRDDEQDFTVFGEKVVLSSKLKKGNFLIKEEDVK